MLPYGLALKLGSLRRRPAIDLEASCYVPGVSLQGPCASPAGHKPSPSVSSSFETLQVPPKETHRSEEGQEHALGRDTT